MNNLEDKRRFKALINGKEYTIVGHKSAQHLNAVVDLLNNQLDQLGEIDPNLSVADRSILIAVNAISDQLAKEYEIMNLQTQLAKQAKKESNNNSEQLNLFDESEETVSKQFPFSRD